MEEIVYGRQTKPYRDLGPVSQEGSVRRWLMCTGKGVRERNSTLTDTLAKRLLH